MRIRNGYTRFFGKGCIQRYNYYHGSLTSETGRAHVDGVQTFMNQGGMAQDVLFEFNTCFDWGQGTMIESAPHVGSVRNWTWRHNIYSSDRPTYKGAWGLNVIQTPDVTIENNTFAGITWFGVVREQGIDLDGKQGVQIHGITVVNTLKGLR